MERLNNDRPIVRLEATESTNLYLKKLSGAQNLKDGTVVVADFQTGGRGQMGNSWFSSKGENLLFSILIYPKEVLPIEQFILSRIASLAVKNTLDQFVDNIRIKWPNDIYWKDQKIAGILIENDIVGKFITKSVIGIGINVNQQSFAKDLPNPVSLRQITGTIHDRDSILGIFVTHFFQLYREFQEGQIKVIEHEYMVDLYRLNDYNWYQDNNGKFMATIENVLPSGHLVLKTMDSGDQRIYAFKEVAFVDDSTV